MIRVHFTTIAFALLLTIFVGCGGNSPFDRSQDPLKDYPGFEEDSVEKTAPPVIPESAPPETQEFLEDNFKMTVAGKLDDEPFSFTRGVPSSYEVTVRNLVHDTVFAYEITTNIDGSNEANEACANALPCLQLQDTQGDTQTYLLTWTPALDFALDQPDFEGRIEFDFMVKDGTSETARNRHQLIYSLKRFAVRVRFQDEPAYIRGAPQLDAQQVVFEESAGALNIDIAIVDPNASNSKRPEIQVSASKPNVDFWAIGFLEPTMSTPELKNGVWVQRHELDITRLAAAYRDKNPGATGQFRSGFTLRAHSTATGKSSPQTWERTFAVKLSGGSN